MGGEGGGRVPGAGGGRRPVWGELPPRPALVVRPQIAQIRLQAEAAAVHQQLLAVVRRRMAAARQRLGVVYEGRVCRRRLGGGGGRPARRARLSLDQPPLRRGELKPPKVAVRTEELPASKGEQLAPAVVAGGPPGERGVSPRRRGVRRRRRQRLRPVRVRCKRARVCLGRDGAPARRLGAGVEDVHGVGVAEAAAGASHAAAVVGIEAAEQVQPVALHGGRPGGDVAARGGTVAGQLAPGAVAWRVAAQGETALAFRRDLAAKHEQLRA